MTREISLQLLQCSHGLLAVVGMNVHSLILLEQEEDRKAKKVLSVFVMGADQRELG